MAAIHQLQSFGAENQKQSSWKDLYIQWSDNRGTRRSPWQPDFERKMHTRNNPSDKPRSLVGQRIGAENAPDAALLSLIWACSKNKDLFRGTMAHNELQKRGLPEKHYADALITMYAKCGELGKAQSLLDTHNSSSSTPWIALISSYARQEQSQNALDCFEQMQLVGIHPNSVAYVYVLKACASIGAVHKGKQIHDEILRQGFLEHSRVLGGALVDMYAKCGALPQARSALEELSLRDVVSWSSLIAGYAQKGQGQQALECFEQMQGEGILPDAVTYVCILKACAGMKAIDKGKQIHDEISRQGLLERSTSLGNALVDMYAKCGALSQAQNILEKLPSCDIVTWNALITGYAQKGHGQQALECFENMQREGIFPDAVTYVSVLKSCAVIGALEKGKQIHDEILKQGLLEHNTVLGGALVDMYAKCGALFQAQHVLENLPSLDVVSWNALIIGYAQMGQGQQALECFEQMHGEGIHPNAVTYLGILKACAVIGAIDKGKEIHDAISKQGLLKHDVALGTALVDMYAKCGAFSEAHGVLEKLPFRNAISWSALIRGYAENDLGQQALKCFEQMQCEGISPDAVTYLCILKACALVGDIAKGKLIHDEILRQGLLEHDIVVGNALVDMYAKCGALLQAESVLENLPSSSTSSWNALIAGYAQEGQGEQALKCFEQMQHNGVLPDMVTFLCLLNLCSHLGLVEKGQELFDIMGAKYGLKPDVECFYCMVDLFGRAGHLVRAVEVIEEMPFLADSSIWLCLLGACRNWVDISVGILAFEKAVEVDKADGAAYILMMNLYAAAGMPEKGKDIEAMRIKNKFWKQSMCSMWTDPNATVHEVLCW